MDGIGFNLPTASQGRRGTFYQAIGCGQNVTGAKMFWSFLSARTPIAAPFGRALMWNGNITPRIDPYKKA
jgi:hypothetical protein